MYDFLKFGDGWKWIRKDVPQCRFEQKYGEHCGTALNNNESILSLREPSDNENYWKIWASFSIDPKGILGYRSGTIDTKDEKSGIIEKRRGIKNQKNLPTSTYIS